MYLDMLLTASENQTKPDFNVRLRLTIRPADMIRWTKIKFGLIKVADGLFLHTDRTTGQNEDVSPKNSWYIANTWLTDVYKLLWVYDYL